MNLKISKKELEALSHLVTDAENGNGHFNVAVSCLHALATPAVAEPVGLSKPPRK